MDNRQLGRACDRGMWPALGGRQEGCWLLALSSLCSPLLDTQQAWKDIPVVPDQWQSMDTGRVVIPAHWQGGLQQCHQPWDSAQGVSGAVRVCILPALLSWVDWAVPARLALWLNCFVQVVLEPRVPGRMFSTLPWGVTHRCLHRLWGRHGAQPVVEWQWGTHAAWSVAAVPSTGTLPISAWNCCSRMTKSWCSCSTTHSCSCSWTSCLWFVPLQKSRSSCNACMVAST